MTCPRCGSDSMTENILPGGSIKHECPGACGYLMVWKPRASRIPEDERTLPVSIRRVRPK